MIQPKNNNDSALRINNLDSNIDKLFSQTKEFWNAVFKEKVSPDDFDIDFINRFPLFNLADTLRSTIAIFNYRDFRPEYISENVKDILGFTKEDYLDQGTKLLFNHIHPHHINFPINSSKCLEVVFNNIDDYNENNILATNCGVKFIHPEKGTIRLLIQQYFIETQDHQIPTRVISTIQDVTHFMKGDHYSMRVIYGNKHQNISTFHSSTNRFESENDIFSNREVEILKLINLGNETEAIAEMLTISRNTVNNHRQNMLDRIGAKDTTSLIELARMCHII